MLGVLRQHEPLKLDIAAVTVSYGSLSDKFVFEVV